MLGTCLLHPFCILTLSAFKSLDEVGKPNFNRNKVAGVVFNVANKFKGCEDIGTRALRTSLEPLTADLPKPTSACKPVVALKYRSANAIRSQPCR